MPTQPPRPPRDAAPSPHTDDTPADRDEASSSSIWFAGLGAFAKAQAEGTKAFEALVREGMSAQRAAQTAARERMQALTQRMGELNEGVVGNAAGRWPGLEGIFENRVARALNALGQPSPSDWAALMARVERLEQALAARSSTPSAPTEAPLEPAAAPRRRRKTAP